MNVIDVADIIGRWDIVSWLQIYDDGRRLAPLGDKLRGFIRYLPDGDMICLIEKADRAHFITGGQWNADVNEQAAAYRTMLAYAGRYRLDGDAVVHEVENSLFPNWVGGAQRRHVRLVDGELFIEAAMEAGTTEARTAQLRWRRAERETK